MSWFSRIKNSFIAQAAGGKPTLPPVSNPTTPVEKAINAAAAVVLPVAASLPGASTVAVTAATVSQALDQIQSTAPKNADPVSGIMSVIGQGAHAAVDNYINAHIGVQAAGFTEDALKTLAVIALSRLQAAQGTSPNAIGAALSDLLKGFEPPAQ